MQLTLYIFVVIIHHFNIINLFYFIHNISIYFFVLFLQHPSQQLKNNNEGIKINIVTIDITIIPTIYISIFIFLLVLVILINIIIFILISIILVLLILISIILISIILVLLILVLLILVLLINNIKHELFCCC